MPIPNPLPPGVEVFSLGSDVAWPVDTPIQGTGTVPGGLTAITVMGTGLSGRGFLGTFAPVVLITLAGVPPELNGNSGTAPGGLSALTIFGLTSFIPYTPPTPPAPVVVVTNVPADPGPKAPLLCGNCYDDLLDTDQCRVGRIDWWPWQPLQSGCSLPPPDPRTWSPRQGRAFNAVGNIPVPAPGSGNTLVNTYTVPRGYVAVLSGLLQTTNQTEYVNGSGDIVWRLRIGRRYLKWFGDSTVKLGTLAAMWPMSDYVLVMESDTVTQLVSVPSSAGGGPGVVTCGLYGWIYPISAFQRAWFGRDSMDFLPVSEVENRK